MLTTQIKMSYKTQKHMKKLYGKNLAREIAFARNMLKLIKKNYGKIDENN